MYFGAKFCPSRKGELGESGVMSTWQTLSMVVEALAKFPRFQQQFFEVLAAFISLEVSDRCSKDALKRDTQPIVKACFLIIKKSLLPKKK